MYNHVESTPNNTDSRNGEISTFGYVSLAIMGNTVAVIAAILMVI